MMLADRYSVYLCSAGTSKKSKNILVNLEHVNCMTFALVFTVYRQIFPFDNNIY